GKFLLGQPLLHPERAKERPLPRGNPVRKRLALQMAGKRPGGKWRGIGNAREIANGVHRLGIELDRFRLFLGRHGVFVIGAYNAYGGAGEKANRRLWATLRARARRVPAA